jgi:hypothetical protein
LAPATGAVATDMAKVRQRKRNMVEREIALHLENYKACDRRGVDLNRMCQTFGFGQLLIG